MKATTKHNEPSKRLLLDTSNQISKILASEVVLPQPLRVQLSIVVAELIAEANSELNLGDAKHEQHSLRLKRKPGIAIIYANKNLPGTVIRDVDGRQDVGTLNSDGIWHPLENN